MIEPSTRNYPLIFGLAPWIVTEFTKIFVRFPEIEKILLFGSRAKNQFRDSSDIDLAIFAPTLTDHRYAALWSQIDELPLVFKVDLVHWDRLSHPALKAKVLQEGVPFGSSRSELASQSGVS
jgi:predicted nucleotidyltransferase